MSNKYMEKNPNFNGLDKKNPNHLKFKHQELLFEIVDGVNSDTFNSLRINIRLIVLVKNKKIIVRETFDLLNEYNLSDFINKANAKTGFAIEFLKEGIEELITELENYKLEIKSEIDNHHQVFELTEFEETEAINFLKKSNLLENINDLIGKSGVIGNEKNRLILFLIYLSRKQDKPLHAIVSSQFNYLQTKVSDTIPNEDKYHISHISDNAIFYFGDDELTNKLLLIEDTGTNKKKLQPLLELQRKGHIFKTITQKDSDGYLNTVQRTVNGPISLSISTNNDENFTNNAVLSYVISEDNSSIQEGKLIQYEQKICSGKINIDNEIISKNLLFNIQRLINSIKIINPFAEQIKLPKELINKHISTIHYLKFIEIITLINQYQREELVDETTGEIFIESSIEDIEKANELLSELLIKKSDELNNSTRIYFEKLKSFIKENEFTNRDIQIGLKTPISTIKRFNSTLLTLGCIIQVGGNRATGYTFKVSNNNEYNQLKNNVLKTLNKIIPNLLASSKLKSSSITNEPTKVKKINKLSKVAQ